MMALLNVLQGIVEGVLVGASRDNQFLVMVCTYYTVHACNQLDLEPVLPKRIWYTQSGWSKWQSLTIKAEDNKTGRDLMPPPILMRAFSWWQC